MKKFILSCILVLFIFTCIPTFARSKHVPHRYTEHPRNIRKTVVKTSSTNFSYNKGINYNTMNGINYNTMPNANYNTKSGVNYNTVSALNYSTSKFGNFNH